MDSAVRVFDVKVCNGCKWFCKEKYICANDASDHLSDYVDPSHNCPEWEERTKNLSGEEENYD